MIKVIIIEDELPAAERLKRMLSELPYSIEVVHMMESIVESIDFLSTDHNFDLIFMDIMLADGNSFEIFKKVTILKPVIFTTAFDSYYLEAFKEYSVDYLLKPVKVTELDNALQKFQQFYQSSVDKNNGTPTDSSKEENWLIKVGHHFKVVDKNDVAYYFTAHKITYLVTFEGKKWPLDVSLENVEDTISNQDYFRANRQYVIHRKAINDMSTGSKSRIKLLLNPTGESTTVSTLRSPRFKKWIKE
jgi:DNA-binding LytR/AlgR family response regulator